jgi:hypothetical protein
MLYPLSYGGSSVSLPDRSALSVSEHGLEASNVHV